MYNIKVEDFINVKENKSQFELNDLIHICKRLNNNKREYLFVNKYQGKHIPENPENIIKLLDIFFNEVKRNLNKNEKILIVGFAETATGIAEYLTYKLSLDNEFCNSIVYHLQTSREQYKDCKKLFTFDEEHSHAVNQFLYCDETLPAYDRILFVEDEITTGNTILNFINEFKKINPNCKYSVSSILNWQNAKNRKIFEENQIERIYLINGEIKETLPHLDIHINQVINYYEYQYDNIEIPSLMLNSSIKNSRKGISPNKINLNHKNVIINILKSKIFNNINEKDDVMVIGTEEFMFYPLMIAKEIQSLYKCNIKYRATTRSPISTCNEDGYIIKDGITLPSAYEKNRQTYLYNMVGKYNKIIVISDCKMTNDFKQALTLFSNKNNKEITFIEI